MRTRNILGTVGLGLGIIALVAATNEKASGEPSARRGRVVYEISVTNITRGQIFSPAVVMTHNARMRPLFQLGHAASEELSMVAEDAMLDPLVEALSASPHSDVVTVLTGENGPILPGETASLTVETDRSTNKVSLVGMMVTTNDGIYALNAGDAPLHVGSTSYRLVGYDAGSEANDELCAHIPGPPCANPGVRATDGAEGYVHVHAGIHGIGDLDASELDWRNPVAQVTIRRVHQ